MSNLNLFTLEEGNLLIRIIFAHILADFVFQTNKMVKNKRWLSQAMLSHVAVVGLCTLMLTFNIALTVAATLLHYAIDAFKVFLLKKWKRKEMWLFVADQLLHGASIVLIWACHFGKTDAVLEEIVLLATNYKVSLVLLGYLVCIGPASYMIRFAVKLLGPASQPTGHQLEQGGKWIGQFERVIILSFVLLNQYEAIGFLITGKSIIRFADKGGNIKSEYVLMGTMLSYAIAILTGILINWLIMLATPV